MYRVALKEDKREREKGREISRQIGRQAVCWGGAGWVQNGGHDRVKGTWDTLPRLLSGITSTVQVQRTVQFIFQDIMGAPFPCDVADER